MKTQEWSRQQVQTKPYPPHVIPQSPHAERLGTYGQWNRYVKRWQKQQPRSVMLTYLILLIPIQAPLGPSLAMVRPTNWTDSPDLVTQRLTVGKTWIWDNGNFSQESWYLMPSCQTLNGRCPADYTHILLQLMSHFSLCCTEFTRNTEGSKGTGCTLRGRFHSSPSVALSHRRYASWLR